MLNKYICKKCKECKTEDSVVGFSYNWDERGMLYCPMLKKRKESYGLNVTDNPPSECQHTLEHAVAESTWRSKC